MDYKRVKKLSLCSLYGTPQRKIAQNSQDKDLAISHRYKHIVLKRNEQPWSAQKQISQLSCLSIEKKRHKRLTETNTNVFKKSVKKLKPFEKATLQVL